MPAASAGSSVNSAYINSSTVKIVIGYHGEPFHIHLDILRQFPKVASSFRLQYLDKPLVTERGGCHLHFAPLFRWLYDRTLTANVIEEVFLSSMPQSRVWKSRVDSFSSPLQPAEFGSFTFWFFLQRFGLEEMQDATVRVICSRIRLGIVGDRDETVPIRRAWRKEALDAVYRKTTPGSQLRLIALEFYGKYCADFEWITAKQDDECNNHTDEQVRDLLGRFRTVQRGKSFRTLPLGSRFDVDDDGNPFAEGEVHPDFLINKPVVEKKSAAIKVKDQADASGSAVANKKRGAETGEEEDSDERSSKRSRSE